MPDPASQHRTIRSYVRREGRLTRSQARALNKLGPHFCIPANRLGRIEAIFDRQAPLTLEIGFGNGDALASMAEQEAETNFIGIEVYRPGVGHLLLELENRGLENVRIVCEDAVEVLRHNLPENTLDRVLLFFPDPWPKKRHHKRRIVQPGFVQLLAGRMRSGGILHMATDWQDYAQHMLAVMGENPDFRNCAGAGNISSRPDYRPVTKFERRGQGLGHDVWDLVFERI
jgi:tRNA (guanine-N7-)-methyltransferase